jgi:4-hydroxy-L-threonine phosphate dehydrogenase PdxA
MDRAVIAITMGDPAGIGPEVAAKVLAQTTTWEICRPLMIGDPQVMDEAAGIAGANVHFREVEHPSEARFAPPGVDVLRPAGLYVPQGVRGTVNPTMGQAAALCLKTAIALAMDGKVQGIVSAPLNKEAFHLAGYGYADELAYLADLTASHDTFMLGMASSIWTAPVTEHVPFRQIPDLITADRVLTSIGRLHAALCRAEVVAPRIAERTCRGGRPVRPGGDRADRAGHHRGQRERHRRAGPSAGRHGFRAGVGRRIRWRSLHVPRPG